MLPAAASKHDRRASRLQAITVAAMRRAWRRMRSQGSLERQYETDVGPKLAAVAVAAQIAAATEADQYIAEVLNELGFGPETAPGVVNPRSLAGVAGDGRPVASLLEQAVPQVRASADLALGLDGAEKFIETVTETLLADAMRAAELVAFADRPWVDGYVRVAEPGACSRCIILAGKFYLWNDGFDRHPRCRCDHLPAPADKSKRDALISINSPDRYFDSLTREEQDRIFTEAGAEAIREGADMARVVNARRGMSRAQVGGRTALVTTEGTTRRGRRAGQREGIRLMPEALMEIANGNREEFVRLLRENGYLN